MGRANRTKVFAVSAIASLTLIFVFCNSDQTNRYVLEQFEAEHQQFKDFIQQHSKSYSTDEEYNHRFRTFLENSAFIRLHNSMFSSWTMTINKFADLKFEEFRDFYLGTAKPDLAPLHENSLTIPTKQLVDWRTEHKVTTVKNQLFCGSCWAFAATGAIESAFAIKTGTLVDLSEQQLIDCSVSYGNKGCNGGLMLNAYQYAVHAGLASDTAYPYEGEDNHCKRSIEKLVQISSFSDVSSKFSETIASAVEQQPVSVAVDASVWMFYHSGVIGPEDQSGHHCGTSLNHGVLIVGYDLVNRYWIVKNSWGSNWGEHGYVRIAMEDGDGVCGINLSASHPII